MQEIIVETKTCGHCWSSFSITDRDSEFYSKISPLFGDKKFPIPSPKLCPECRNQRRHTFRQERKLYHRKCDFSWKEMISLYHPASPYRVYDQSIRRSDQWDPLSYGRDFDFNIPMFDQIDTLRHEVPRINLNSHNSNENSEYANYIVHGKNSYLCFGGGYVEDIMYSNYAIKVKDGSDIFFSIDNEVCYQATHCFHCHSVFYAHNCNGCSECYFIEDSVNCHHCILCSGLVNKQYCRENKQLSKEEFLIKKEEFLKWLSKDFTSYQEKFTALSLSIPKLAIVTYHCEDCEGNHLYESKRCSNVVNLKEAEDCKYCNEAMNINDVYDSMAFGLWGQLCYEMMTASMELYRCSFGQIIRDNCQELYYCTDMVNCSYCFACTGLKTKQYCILNKQYTKEEYEKLVPQIIEKMDADGERGEFFPSRISPFGYNETVAMENLPLTKEQALSTWFTWCDYEAPFPKVESVLEADQLPSIQEVTNDILKQAIICETTGKPFRIVKQELEFYRKYSLPLPKRHPDRRHLDRMEQYNQRKLRDRQCMKCWKDIKATYAPEKPEIVYCEWCYNKEIYG